jgi:S1-C subfamily serine protease
MMVAQPRLAPVGSKFAISAILTVTLVILVAWAGISGATIAYLALGDQKGSATIHTSVTTSTVISTVSLGSTTASSNELVLPINPVQIYQEDNRSIVTVEGALSSTQIGFFGPQTVVSQILGSGFVTEYNNTYYIVTNFYVVNGVQNLTVTFSDGDAYPATVVGKDPYSDLAVVKVTNAPTSEYYPLMVVSSSSLKVGEAVAAIGNPFGLSGSMTVGVVSQLGRTITETTAGNFSIADVIQFSAPINPGNSGGPLLDQSGDVVGITTATVSGSQGVGFAIPSSTILKELPSLIASGAYDKHSYLGISTVDMNYQLAQYSGTNVTYGVLIESVVNGGPAAKAGLEAGTKPVVVDGTQYLVGGDIIVSVNGTKIVNGDALSSYLEEYTVAGQAVQLGIIRGGGHFITVDVTLGTRPPPPQT